MRTLGAFLLIVGIVFLAYGIVGAVLELGATYQRAADDAMAMTEQDEGVALATRMAMHLVIGAIGVLPMIAGTILLRVGIIRRLLRGPKAAQYATPGRGEVDEVV